MSPLAWMLIALSQLGLVGGQIFLKRAMSRRERGNDQSRGWRVQFGLGIALMTVWFLLWLGVMHRVDLSQLMPLEGISPVLIVLGAMLFLGERPTWQGWAGVGLTCVGVVCVSLS